jgi:hypothetical protein
MSTVARDAFQRELRQLREFSRGDVTKGVASFRCDETHCPVNAVRIGFEEVRGERKPMQPPARCPRCGSELCYVGMEKHR